MSATFSAADAGARGSVPKLSPTLIIGLGGTGGEVLVRIRERFIERFGGLHEFPIVDYLWLDTDKSYKDVGTTQLANKLNFATTEELMLTIKDTGTITSRLHDPMYRNIESWWPLESPTVQQLDEGASQCRPYGRLGFYYHYPEVRRSLMEALEHVHRPDRIEKVQALGKLSRLNYAVELDMTERNVYVIASLGGGTGSGMFLDVAYLVRQLAPSAVLFGFFMTSRFFPAFRSRLDANTYAALLEWDYYNDHEFVPTWSNGEIYPAIKPPAFNYSYLLDNPNSAHLALRAETDGHKKMCEILADNLFKEFSQGFFSQARRSARVNSRAFIGYKAIYPPKVLETYDTIQQFRQRFNRNYQSFGLASIKVPHDRIIAACANKLAADLVLYWKRKGADDASIVGINEDVNGFMSSSLLDTNSVLGRLDDASAVGEKTSSAGTLITNISRFAEQVFDAARTRPILERPDFLDDEVKRFRLYQFASSARVQNAGMIVNIINQNLERIVASAKETIDDTCDRRIDIDGLSVDSTIKFLERVGELLEQAHRLCAEHLETIGTRIEDLEAEYKQRLNDLRMHVSRHNFDFRKKIILDYDELLLRETVVGCGDHLNAGEDKPGLLPALRQRALLEAAITVFVSLIDFILAKSDEGVFHGSTLGRLHELDLICDRVASTLQSDATYFGSRYDDGLSLVLFDSAEIDAIYYNKYVTPATIDQISDYARNMLHVTVTLFRDSNWLRREEGRQLIDLCRQVFDPIRRDFHIVDVLFQRFGGWDNRYGHDIISGEMAAELNRVYSSARYWACGGTDATRHYMVEQDQEVLLVGLPDVPRDLPESDRIRIRRRRDAIEGFLKDQINQRITFTDTLETSELIFYSELSGVPLNFFSSMYELRSAYLTARAKDAALHLESKEASKFEDVLILSDEEKVRLQEALQCLTLCALFDEIWTRQESGKLVFGYNQTVRGVDSHPRLGDERQAILFLQNNADVTGRLLQTCNTKLSDYEQQLQSSDQEVAQGARKVLVSITSLIVTRMETLSAQAPEHNWTDLPTYPQMEYLACDGINRHLHAICRWESFDEDIRKAKENLTSTGTRRADGRYAVRLT